MDARDTHRWLEDGSDPAVAAWQRDQDQSAAAYLRTLPAFDAVRALTPAPTGRAGGETPPELPAAELDAAAYGAALVAWTAPSPDGTLSAYGLGDGMADATRLLIRAAGQDVPTGLGNAWIRQVVWEEGGGSLLAVEVRTVGEVQRSRVLRVMTSGPDAGQHEEVLDSDDLFLFLQPGPHATTAVVGGDLFPKPTQLISADGTVAPFAPPGDYLLAGQFVGDGYLGVTTLDADRGRVVEVPADTAGDPATWRTLIEESATVLRSLTATDDVVITFGVRDAAGRIAVHGRDGALRGEPTLPGPGAIGPGYHWQGEPRIAITDGGPWSSYSSPGVPPTPFTIDPTSGEAIGLSDAPPDPYLTTFHAWPANDGAAIPVHVTRRPDLDLAAPRPTVIRAYGGWNVVVQPGFLAGFAAFVDAGGVVVDAHVRGGGELGSGWWRAGRQRRKKRAVDDVLDVAAAAVDRGVAGRDALALWGTSNGALVMGAACALAPDRFRAVSLLVGKYDMLRPVIDPHSLTLSILEYGDPRVPEDVEAMLSYSPYHNVLDGRAYPAVLVHAGEADPRCPPWHSRKFVARLQETTTSGHPVLLRITPSSGHVPRGTTADDRMAESVAFLIHELGLPGSWTPDPTQES